MKDNTNIKTLPVWEVLKSGSDYFGNHLKEMLGFSFLNYVSMVLGYFTWKSLWIWPLLAAVYILWSFFFRYYFNRKPYLLLKTMAGSLVPSTKIVVLGALFATLLAVLPFAPLFMGLSQDFNDRYMQFLQNYMQDSDYVDLGLNVILVLVSPWLFYRPFLAWISAVIGRSGVLRTAWSRTEGNYWQFLLLGLIFNFGVVLVMQVMDWAGVNILLMMVFLAPLVTYYNIVMAKIYEFFYMEID